MPFAIRSRGAVETGCNVVDERSDGSERTVLLGHRFLVGQRKERPEFLLHLAFHLEDQAYEPERVEGTALAEKHRVPRRWHRTILGGVERGDGASHALGGPVDGYSHRFFLHGSMWDSSQPSGGDDSLPYGFHSMI